MGGTWRAVLIGMATAATAAAQDAARPAAQPDDVPVDVALVLAVDISLSMDRAEQRAQRDGYIDAMTHPAVLDAIGRGRHGRVAIAYVEWGGPWTQRIVADWTVVSGRAEAEGLAADLAMADYQTSRGTSMSAGIDFALTLLDQAPPADRRVIDVSGDGPNNMGAPVTAARDRATARGVEINGLPVMLGEPDLVFSIPDLDIYFEECVVTGPVAFVVPVLRADSFAAAIRQKLVLEIAALRPRDAAPPALHRASARIDCMIGEKLYERWRRGVEWN